MKEELLVAMSGVASADAVTFRYDVRADEPSSYALVTVLSAISGAAPTELAPVGGIVDLEAMDDLLDSTGENGAFAGAVLLFADGYCLCIDESEIVGVAREEVMA